MTKLVKYIKYNNLRSSRVFCLNFSLVLRCLSTHLASEGMTEIMHAGHCCLNSLQPSCTFLLDLFPVCFFLFFVWADAWRFSVKDPSDVWPCFPTKTIHVHICHNNNFSFPINPSEGQREKWKPRCHTIIMRMNHLGNETQMYFSGSTCILEIGKGKCNIHTHRVQKVRSSAARL